LRIQTGIQSIRASDWLEPDLITTKSGQCTLATMSGSVRMSWLCQGLVLAMGQLLLLDQL
jgi:hypothetical protein